MTSSHPLTGSTQLSSQPGEWSGSLLDVGILEKKPDEPGVTSKRPRPKKRVWIPWDSRTVPLMVWMVEIHWGKMGREASYKTGLYLDLVGALPCIQYDHMFDSCQMICG